MNISLVAILAFFFGLAAASLALRIATSATSSDGTEDSTARSARAQAGLGDA